MVQLLWIQMNHMDSSGLLRDSRISMSYFGMGHMGHMYLFYPFLSGKRTAVTPCCSSGTVHRLEVGQLEDLEV